MLFQTYIFGSSDVWFKYFDNILGKFNHGFKILTYSTDGASKPWLSAHIYLMGQNHHQSQRILCFLKTVYASKNIPILHVTVNLVFLKLEYKFVFQNPTLNLNLTFSCLVIIKLPLNMGRDPDFQAKSWPIALAKSLYCCWEHLDELTHLFGVLGKKGKEHLKG